MSIFFLHLTQCVPDIFESTVQERRALTRKKDGEQEVALEREASM